MRTFVLLALMGVSPSCLGGGSGNGDSGGGGTPSGLPVITSFTAAPSTLPAGGGPVTLAWSVTGADQITIDQGVGPVAGTQVESTIGATTIFTLTASNSAGAVTRSAIATVAPSANVPVILWFTATPYNLPAGGGSVTLSWQVL